MTNAGQAGRPAGVAGWLIGMIMARLNADMEHAGVELLGLHGDDRALEIGYGPGIGISALLAALPHGRVAGIDPSPVMWRQASRRAGTAKRVDLRIGEVSSLPWPDAEFDGILAVNTAQFWPDPAADVAEAVRVLAPGGRIVIALRTGGRHGHAPLAASCAELLAVHALAVTRDARRMRTGPAVFLRGQRLLLAA
ncbi:MAG TPA: class I SAM-dependent methyltransferase [Trebonia sp.]